MSDIPAYCSLPTNGHLIEACAKLGYLDVNHFTLDPTFGLGTFWKLWQPTRLVRCDLDPEKSPDRPFGADFTDLPFNTGSFASVVFDPPYKLNGTPSRPDERYGVAEPARWQDRIQLILRGLDECARVYNGRNGRGCLLVKCQDQVVSGKVRWQTHLVIEHAERLGLGLVDRFDLLGGRAQPDGRTQCHARRNASTLLVFKRGATWRPA